MLENIDIVKQEVEAFLIQTKDDAERFRNAFLARKGRINDLFAAFRDVPGELKKEFGQRLNELRTLAEERLAVYEAAGSASGKRQQQTDVTRPSGAQPTGGRHPVSLVRDEIIGIFSRIGFSVSDGPEMEDDWHNFTALNFPPEHPARDMQDTFFITTGDNPIALRTHTSSVQVRVMETERPPIRSLMPGRVFRNEAISARSHCIFHQIEGLYIDQGVSFADLKQTLLYFAREMFGEDREIRLRPSFFPFTEPSAEVDVYWGLKTETDYRITKGTGWLEIMGCGMVHPNVLTNCGINTDEYTGFAFGMGLERIALLRYQMGDIRLFFENDMRMLEQFMAAV
jgi:phenylalanyl-tRNA synthetase alpha chain